MPRKKRAASPPVEPVEVPTVETPVVEAPVVEVPKVEEPKPPERKIYFATAARYQIAGWVKEERAGNGQITRGEQSLIFGNYLRITDDLVMQAFIENSKAYANGHVKLCKDMRDAEMSLAKLKQVTDMRTGGVGTIDIQPVIKSAAGA